MKKRIKNSFLFLLSLFFLGTPGKFITGFTYPLINSLDNSDILFKQLQEDIGLYYKELKSNKQELSLRLFTYKINSKDDFFSIASRLNLPYDTIATLNQLNNPQDFKNHEILFIPNIPGIYLSSSPVTDLEKIMTTNRDSIKSKSLPITLYRGNEKLEIFFFAGDKFFPAERSLFLKVFFHYPLIRNGIITSGFGKRVSPFSRRIEQHNGIDISVIEGTEVLAAKDGIIFETGYSIVYGNYIMISHPDNYITLYGHLKEILVKVRQSVFGGMVIAKSGNTGQSTGAHLHFEIRKDNAALNPSLYLF